MAACPSNPGNVKTIRELAGMPVSQVLIGSCTNSSLKDLRLVANVLKDKVVSTKCSVGIAPGSRQVLTMLARDGHLQLLIDAGCRILESACGPCIGQGFSPASGTISVRTFNRNFLNRTGTPNDKCYLVSPETAVATALNGVLTDPRTLDIPCPQWSMPEHFLVDDRMIIVPPADGSDVDIIRKETIGEPPHCTPLPDTLNGQVLLKLGDKITTDHIMPAGANLKLRSNIPRYAQVVFDCFNEPGKPTFAQRAAAVRDSGKAGIVVAAESYGQGSSREHAAICPMYLGVRCIIALSIERIHAANLINFGILPLSLQHREDLELIQQDDQIVIKDLHQQVLNGNLIKATLVSKDGTERDLMLTHSLSEQDQNTVLKGGVLA